MATSRLAPSPTGALHLGNACSFLCNWALARSGDWELLYRLEDLCGSRKSTEAVSNVLETFQWLGLDWDGEMHIQSDNLEPYIAAINILQEQNLVYHCSLSRKEIEAVSSAPQSDDVQVKNPIRPTDIHKHNNDVTPTVTNWRFVTNQMKTTLHDHIQGDVEVDVQNDFVVWTKDGYPSYQLAVVVDDHLQGVTEVVRANDLLESASRQTMLYEAMRWEIPHWWHLPLVIGQDGRKLAKRHGDTRVLYFRDQGVLPERIIGLVAYWCHLQKDRANMSLNEFLALFDYNHLPRDTITCTKKDLSWLLD